jgi:protocatechuate 3,4-dioxygenase beta subunit
MPTRRRGSRWRARAAAIVAALVVLPALVGFAAETAKSSKLTSRGRKPASAAAAILRGRVTGDDDAPLANARVRIAIPAADMRFVDPTTSDKQLETKTDAHGDYRLEIPGTTEPTTISIDAMKPGYRRLVGTLMSGGNAQIVKVAPGKAVEADLKLRPALYIAGTVVDELGKPIPGVHISANASSDAGSGGVERTASNADGSFEIFNYDLAPVVFEDGATRGAVYFFHQDYIDHRIADVYALEAKQRQGLRIVLKTGQKVAGRVLDVDGKPVPKAMVKAIRTDGTHRKATVTDENGRFALRGLDKGLTKLSVRALAIRQKALVPVASNTDRDDLEIRLRDIELPADLKTYSVLGMQLADLTPEVKDAYDLFYDSGAVIIDPGKDSDRLQIGQLSESFCFWMVGNEEVGSVREFIEQILTETANQNAAKHSVRVVYGLSTPEFDGTNTQYLPLTNDDLKQLQAVLDEITSESL